MTPRFLGKTEVMRRLLWLRNEHRKALNGEPLDTVTIPGWGWAGVDDALALIEEQFVRIEALEKYRDDAQVFANERLAAYRREKHAAKTAIDLAVRVQRLLETTLDAVQRKRP